MWQQRSPDQWVGVLNISWFHFQRQNVAIFILHSESRDFVDMAYVSIRPKPALSTHSRHATNKYPTIFVVFGFYFFHVTRSTAFFFCVQIFKNNTYIIGAALSVMEYVLFTLFWKSNEIKKKN